jgi:hypothetical protein
MRHLTMVLGVLALLVVVARGHPAPVRAQDSGAPPVVTYRGSYNGGERLVLGPFDLRAGVTIVRARHGGTDVFAVDLVSPTPGRDPREADFQDYHPLIASIGRFDGAATAIAALDAPYYLLVGAGGAYELRVEQPLPRTVTPVGEREFIGVHQQVTPVLALPAGPTSVTATCTGEFRCYVWLYLVDALGGGLVSSGYIGTLIAGDSGPYEETATMDLPVAGLYFFQVYAAPENAHWTLWVR